MTNYYIQIPDETKNYGAYILTKPTVKMVRHLKRLLKKEKEKYDIIILGGYKEG
jgi:hypothetical protein